MATPDNAGDAPAGSAEELTNRNVRKIIELEEAAKASITTGERVAAYVAAFCGSMTFVWIHLIGFSGWIYFNTSSSFAHHPDPFPYTMLSLCVALEAIFLSGFILINQNQEKRLTEQRSHLDLQLNLLIEQENTMMLTMLKHIADKVGAHIHEDHAALAETTRPETLIDQIGKATGTKPGKTEESQD